LLAVAGLVLTGCYETRQPVLGRGVEVPGAPGLYRCQNERDRDASPATISAPAWLGSDDVVHVATLDSERHVIRIAALPDGLFQLEARGDYGGARHVFVRRHDADRYDLLVTGTQSRERLAALAGAHGVAIEFPDYGPPRIAGPPDRLRAFLLAHTPAMLERTATCRRLP
jgi:hypothetical protein